MRNADGRGVGGRRFVSITRGLQVYQPVKHQPETKTAINAKNKKQKIFPKARKVIEESWYSSPYVALLVYRLCG
jgi:hypothetical protein